MRVMFCSIPQLQTANLQQCLWLDEGNDRFEELHVKTCNFWPQHVWVKWPFFSHKTFIFNRITGGQKAAKASCCGHLLRENRHSQVPSSFPPRNNRTSSSEHHFVWSKPKTSTVPLVTLGILGSAQSRPSYPCFLILYAFLSITFQTVCSFLFFFWHNASELPIDLRLFVKISVFLFTRAQNELILYVHIQQVFVHFFLDLLCRRPVRFALTIRTPLFDLQFAWQPMFILSPYLCWWPVAPPGGRIHPMRKRRLCARRCLNHHRTS